MRAIYDNPETGTVSIIIPAEGIDLMLEARRIVPVGIPFWIVADSELPTDRTFRNAWEIDEAALGQPDGIGENQSAMPALPEGAAQ